MDSKEGNKTERSYKRHRVTRYRSAIVARKFEKECTATRIPKVAFRKASMSRMRAIRWYVWLALLTAVLAVPASPKVRPDDLTKGKKTTPIAPGGGKKDVTMITATTASRPIANATFPYALKNTTLHLSSPFSASPSSLAAATSTMAAATATMTATAAVAVTTATTAATATAMATATSAATTAEIAVTSATTTLKLPTIVTRTTPSLVSTAAFTTNATSDDLDITSGITSSSSTFTETSPRIISPTQHTATVLSRKSTAAAAAAAASSSAAIAAIATNVTTTAPLTSAKETRESPGKIRPQIKLTTNYTSISETGVRLPEGASVALAKPTKYHYYPHNQHIYLLPECAVQQVCNAVYVRLNFTQPLCACPGRYRDPCSASLDSDDLHTTELVTDPRTKALTLVKTCEPVAEMRECRASRDWSLLALQNVRTGKSHYLVICRCPDTNILEGPMSHDQPTYASVPGIRVYGMMCVQGNRRGRPLRHSRSISEHTDGKEKPRFPWHKVRQLMVTSLWE
ncbi:uncharacterized protein LOC105185298 isoform X2 [Harpegnathos saltator]|uniref:uncharacterized protein LOC105185298 isoform X2 n=1 Tax=Harpegnathos saltator TaxID=610380 RepID=UPI000DBEDF93|nr:uncharacterized protein LOC105185298 isoform X2 [Harpegnathos saltator]